MCNSSNLKNIPTSILFLLFTLFTFQLNAQTVLWQEDFDKANGLPNGWTASNSDWSVADKATIEQNTAFGLRAAPQSESGNQAALFTADQGPAGFTLSGTLTSSSIQVDNFTKLHLRFNQSYRAFESSTKVELSINGGQFEEIYNNDFVSNNVHTGKKDLVIIPLSVPANQGSTLQLRFTFEGKHFYWSIDDVKVIDGNPHPPTYPTYFGDFLHQESYPFKVSDSLGAYVPKELIVKYDPSVTDSQRIELQRDLGVSKVSGCPCNPYIELVTLGDYPDTGPSPSAQGPTLDINERKDKGEEATYVDAIDFNFYNYDRLEGGSPTNNPPLQACPNPTPPTGDTKVIAILDTGIDYNHPDLQNYIWKNSDDGNINSNDEDANCYVDDCIGWNFVDNNNNPFDNHGGGHGTHVAGIVTGNFVPAAGCSIRLMPLKTHDHRGVGKLINVICATYYAIDKGADILNMSFGYYGEPSSILRDAIFIDPNGPKNDFVVVTASGNDATDLDTRGQFPACYTTLNNLVAVGSKGVSGAPSTFSNHSWSLVDLLAPGESIVSTIPGGGTAAKDGTSASAPYISASIAMAYCVGAPDYGTAIGEVGNCANNNPSAPGGAVGQKLYDTDTICLGVVVPFISQPIVIIAFVLIAVFFIWRFFFRRK